LAELDRITSSLAINDPLRQPQGGQGSPPVPEEEDERDPFELGFRAFAARAGVEPTKLQQSFQEILSVPTEDIVQEEREKRNLFHRLMGRGKMGKVIDLPGPIDIYNPLKMGWSGLEAIQDHVATPLAGLAYGGGAIARVWIDNHKNTILGFDGDKTQTEHELRKDQFLAALSHRGGGIKGLWQGAGDFNRDREALFWGEKFISSIIFDPTSYMGWGLLAKVPKVGVTGFRISTRLPTILGGFNIRTLSRVHAIDPKKTKTGNVFRDKHGFVSKDNPARRRLASFNLGLGALEAGYVEAFNLPFRAAIYGYKKMPESAQLLTKKTTRQSGNEFGDLTHNRWTENVVEAVGGGQNYRAISIWRWRQAWAEKISNMEVRSAELTKPEAIVRDMLYGNHSVTPAMLVQLGRKVKGTLSLTDKQLSETIGPQGIEFQGSVLSTFSEEFSKLVRMETSISEASEQIIRQAGGQHSDEVYRNLESYLHTYTTAVHKNVENRIMNNTLSELRSLIVNDATNLRITQIDTEIALRRKGMLGAFLSGFDEVQKKVYQRGLRRHAIRPMGTAVLIFPGFPAQEFVEGSTRQIFGDSALGMRNAMQFDETLSFFGGGPVRIAELNAMSRKTSEDLTRVGGGGINEGSIGLQNEWLSGLSDTFIQKIFSKGRMNIQDETFNWFNPVDYVRMTGAISGGMRRRFLMSRMYQRSVNYLTHTQPELVAAIDKSFPDDAIQGGLVNVIHEAMVLRIMTGNSDAVRDLPRLFSAEVITKKEAFEIIDALGADGNLPPVAMQQMRDWATHSRRHADLPELLVDVKELAKEEFISGFEGFLHNMKGMRGVLQKAVDDLDNLKKTSPIVTREEKAKIKDLAYHVYQSIDDMSHRLDGILQDTAARVNAKATLAQKETIWNNAHKEIRGRMDEADLAMEEISEVLRKLEIDAFEESFVADHFLDEWKLTSKTWIDDRDFVDLHFQQGRNARKKTSFWEALRAGRNDIWTDYRNRRLDLKETGRSAQSQMESAIGQRALKIKENPAIDFKGKDMTMKDIGFIVGAGADNMSQALINGVIMTEDEFAKYVMMAAGRYKMKNVSERAVRQARRDLLGEINLTDAIQTGQEGAAKQVDDAFYKLRGIAKKESWRDVHTEALQGYANGIADKMDQLGGGFLKKETAIQAERRIARSERARVAALTSGRPRQIEEAIEAGGGIRTEDFDVDIGALGETVPGTSIDRRTDPSFLDPRTATTEELSEAMEKAGRSEHDMLVQALGSEDAAKKFERLDRTANSVNTPRERQEAAYKELQDMIENLTPEQERLIYGNIKDPDITAESLKELRDAGAVIAREDEIPELTRVMVRGLSRLTPERVQGVLGASRGEAAGRLLEDVVQYRRVQASVEAMRELGLSTDQIFQNAVRRLRSEGIEDADIDVLLGPFMRGDKLSLAPPTGGIDDVIGATTGATTPAQRKIADINQKAEAAAIQRGQAVIAREQARFTRPGQRGVEKLGLKKEGMRVLDDSMSDLNKAFVNYDGSTMIDDLAQGVFPFWVYESRRIPYLLRTGFQKPIIWSTIMPEGRYWEATDDGYIPVWAQKWMDMNIFGGTMFNTPRRFARAQFPEQHISGFQGAYSKAETQLGRFGFYFGTHVSAVPEMLLPILGVGTSDDRGELLPPLISGPASLVEMGANPLPGTQKHIPYIQDFSRGFGKMRRSLFPDRFREFFLGRILAERGLDVTELNWDTMKPKTGAHTLTQQDINDAMSLAAFQEWVSESMGNVRFEGPNKKRFDDQRDEFISRWTPLTVEQIRSLRKDGVNPTNLYPLPAPVRRIFDEIPNAVNFGLSSSRLSAGEVRAFEDHVSEFWEAVDARRKDLFKEQEDDDDRWADGVQEGGISPAAWRSTREGRGGVIADTMNFLRGMKQTPEGEVTVFNPSAEYRDVPISFEELIATSARFGNDSLRLRHPFDDLMARFFEIVPKDTDGDGFVNWNTFFDERQDFLDNQLPISLREVFEAELDKNLSRVEQELAKIQRTYLGDYWNIEDRVVEEMGVEEIVNDVINAQRFDPFNAEFLRTDPSYKAYRKTLRLERQFAREMNPRLDYALNIFGFTGQTMHFASPEAQSWWESDGKKPDLSRLTR
jgi:hypothetical protein